MVSRTGPGKEKLQGYTGSMFKGKGEQVQGGWDTRISGASAKKKKKKTFTGYAGKV